MSGASRTASELLLHVCDLCWRDKTEWLWTYDSYHLYTQHICKKVSTWSYFCFVLFVYEHKSHVYLCNGAEPLIYILLSFLCSRWFIEKKKTKFNTKSPSLLSSFKSPLWVHSVQCPRDSLSTSLIRSTPQKRSLHLPAHSPITLLLFLSGQVLLILPEQLISGHIHRDANTRHPVTQIHAVCLFF